MRNSIPLAAVLVALLVCTTTANANSRFSDLIRLKAKETVSEVIATQAARVTDRVLDKAVTQVVAGGDQSVEQSPDTESVEVNEATHVDQAVDDYAELEDAGSVE